MPLEKKKRQATTHAHTPKSSATLGLSKQLGPRRVQLSGLSHISGASAKWGVSVCVSVDLGRREAVLPLAGCCVSASL